MTDEQWKEMTDNERFDWLRAEVRRVADQINRVLAQRLAFFESRLSRVASEMDALKKEARGGKAGRG